MPIQPTHAGSCRLLEISAAATPEEIRRAYQRLAMLWHPDRFEPGSALHTEAQEKIQAINEAYRYLQDHPRPEPVPVPIVPPAPKAGPSWFWAVGLVAMAGMAWALAGSFREVQSPGQDLGPPPSGPAAPRIPPGEARPEPAHAPPSTLVVDEAALVIFWPSKQELEAAPNARANEIAQFLETAQEVRDKVQKARPELKVFLTDAELIKLQGVTVRRSETCGYGYLVFAPPKQQQVMAGLQDIGKMVSLVCENFPLQDEKTRADQVP